MKFNNRTVKRVVVVLIVAFVVIQFIPVDRTNPPVESEMPAPAEVQSVLKRACYDCHSNETVWPWYSKVAPVSWLIADDVHDGRAELNMSTWDRYTVKRQLKKFKEIRQEVDEGEMPPWQYNPLHPAARLSAADKELLHNWSLSMTGQDSTGR